MISSSPQPVRLRTPPVDDVKLNRFVAAYNEYVTRLMRGQLDLKQWAAVVRAWEALQ